MSAAQGQVGIVNVKKIWRMNQEFWNDKNLPLQQEIIFASTGVKKKTDPPDKNVEALAVSDIQTIVFHLTERGIGVLITDHHVRETLRITDRAYIVHDGVIFRSGTPESLAADEDVRRIYLGTEFRLD